MTWSPLARLVTPGPTSTTMPAPSWPRIAGNRPSGSAPERVNSSVWQMPVAFISISTSPALGPSRSTVSMLRGFPAWCATAAFTFICRSVAEPPRASPDPRALSTDDVARNCDRAPLSPALAAEKGESHVAPSPQPDAGYRGAVARDAGAALARAAASHHGDREP